MEDQPLLPLSRVAELLGVDAAWLKAQACEGELPSVDAQPEPLFDVTRVTSILAERAQGPSFVSLRRAAELTGVSIQILKDEAQSQLLPHLACRRGTIYFNLEQLRIALLQQAAEGHVGASVDGTAPTFAALGRKRAFEAKLAFDLFISFLGKGNAGAAEEQRRRLLDLGICVTPCRRKPIGELLKGGIQ